MEKQYCPGCKTELRRMGVETIRLDREKHASLFSSKDRTVLADVYVCPACGRLERFSRAVTGGDPAPASIYDGEDAITCTRCGKVYQPAFGYCPCCGWVEEEKI